MQEFLRFIFETKIKEKIPHFFFCPIPLNQTDNFPIPTSFPALFV